MKPQAPKEIEAGQDQQHDANRHDARQDAIANPRANLRDAEQRQGAVYPDAEDCDDHTSDRCRHVPPLSRQDSEEDHSDDIGRGA
jgi:hypothetical protein